MYTSIWMVFLFPLAAHTTKSFSLLSYPFGAAIAFSTFLQFIEYTCLAFAIVEVLFYTVEPRLCSYAIFAKCRFIHSKDVDAYILLKPYTSSTFNHIPHRHYEQIHARFFTLNTSSLCTYHLHDRSTQQISCEVEIAIFPDIFMTQQTAAK
mgnify:CR=1 FL=1